MKKDTAFRLWLQELWFLHRQEVLSWEHKPVNYEMDVWFNRYKWWLRREFQFQQKKVKKS